MNPLDRIKSGKQTAPKTEGVGSSYLLLASEPQDTVSSVRTRYRSFALYQNRYIARRRVSRTAARLRQLQQR